VSGPTRRPIARGRRKRWGRSRAGRRVGLVRRHGAVVRVCESDLGSISADQYNAAQAYIATVTATH
jgi:hypothetical protein